ncbi:MAG: lysylphosphatidylglycerol synthase transmembrane domain-containing protein [Anaerolineae bacterium]
MSDLRNKLVIGFILGLVVIVALLLYADLTQVIASLESFTWAYLPLILGLTLSNYALRFVKWHVYLRLINVTQISIADSLLIFVGGFTMVLSPGKVGELLKSLALKEMTGTPISRSAPVIMAERLSDGLAMLLLAMAGVAANPRYLPLFLLVLGLLSAGVLVIQIQPLAYRLLALAERMPVLSRFARALYDFYASSFELLRLKNLLFAVGLGTLSWALEGVALYLVLIGLGVAPGATLLGQAIFILSFATIVGALSALPGGLGAAEASLGVMLGLVVGLDRSLAGTVTLMIRFCTLWFAVLLGMSVLIFFRQRLFPQEQLPLKPEHT